MADQEPHCACPEIKVDSEANGFTQTTNTCRPFWKQKRAHEKFQIFFFLNLKALECTEYILGHAVNLTGAYIRQWVYNSHVRDLKEGAILVKSTFMFD